MRLSTLPALVAYASSALAAPTIRGASPGFPTPNQQQLNDIEVQAGGRLSNAPPPPKLAPSTLTALQLIAFNELFEVAFFSSLLANITSGVSGYELDGQDDELPAIIKNILAQEELHALDAITTLEHFNAFAPSPCSYTFPTTNLTAALSLAETFTALVLGTLQDASQLLAANGDAGPVRDVASIIGQEGEQSGFYRSSLGRLPSAKPFLTTSVAPYAFSALQAFVVPGSCPFALSEIDIPIFPALQVAGGMDVAAEDQTLSFAVDLGSGAGNATASKYVGGSGEGLFVTYLTGQLLPISVPVQNVKWSGHEATFDAEFPFEENVMTGLTIAGLTVGGNFTGPDELPAKTLAAPGLIQVNVLF